MEIGASVNAEDWLVQVDDLLTHRLTHCTACGCQPVTWGEIIPLPGFVFTCVLCQTCDRRRDDAIALLVNVVPRRYGKETV